MSVRRANTIVSIIVLLALLIQPLAAGAAATGLQSDTATTPTPAPQQPGQGFLFRASVTLAGSRNLARLEKVGALVLGTFDSDGAQTALVLADGEQLADLARLGFRPQAADELRLLVSAQGPEKAWLVESLQPLLAQTDVVVALQAVARVAGVTAAPDATAEAVALQALRTFLRALTPEQIAAVANSSSVDDDADGLTNTQEAWWCTDPMDTDTDDDGRTDGAEIQVLKDWMANERAGAPNETPWPSWPFNTTTCPDKDYDSIPNLAERWELGLNMDLESSDRDKFDDGQELFGVTYCPGGDLSCGYGDLPRSADSGYVGATMPSWIRAPGKHPLVAAFPVPEVDVVESSLHVQAVTTITTDHAIASGTEKSYSTAKTEGTSTSVANTTMWNEWEEVSLATPVGDAQRAALQGLPPGLKITGAGLTFLGSLGALALCAGPQAALCAGVGLVALTGSTFGLADAFAELHDQRQTQVQQNTKLPCNPYNQSCPGYTSFDFGTKPQSCTDTSEQNATRASTGMNYTQDAQAQSITLQPVVQAVFPAPRPVLTQTSGRSHGGAQTTTTEQYEEHTITNGEAFSNEESWGSATAVDSAHSADLWFTYNVRNSGTEYAREIKHLAFNIYIGDNPNPACTYHVGSTACGVPVDTVLFANFMPGEEHPYTSFRIPLTLEQMRAVDLGGPIRVVVEDFTYGADELFYQDAANAGVLIAMEDGTDDGEETIDTYLAPTWGTETVLDVLARYFPHTTDADGMLTAIWTPKYRADTPAWCIEPQVVGLGAQRTLWCKHALSTADWWNVYTDGMGDGSEGFQNTPASPGQVALFRFNKDFDLDGYSNRSEARLGTDPNDPADYPRPELLAGVHTIRSGNHVTATLSLLNTGLYDAYGVEAVMIAPNNTISITNNTVGGSGRVRAQKQVIVGSRIATQTPLPAAWLTAGHAQPSAGGYYTGASDRTYTFIVQCGNSGGCVVGTDAWALTWNDGEGVNGSLSFDATYKSPTLRDIGAFGVKLGFVSGKVNNGETFTMTANTPRDTFQYTIAADHQSDFTPPVVLVSYNDPQGNHRFVVPPAAMSLSSPTTDLMAFSGQVLRDPGVEIVTSAAFAAGANTTDLVINNPTQTELAGAHLFLEFIDPEGAVVSEVPVTVNLPAGPTVVPVDWSTSGFSPEYSTDQDYIVMAFWTDYQGNILDTAARPLSSFQEDPKPAFAMTVEDETWDFGTAQQGTLMQRQFTLASVGYADLLTHLGSAISITVEGPASQPLSPGDMGVYTVTVNTQYLPVGPFQETIPVRTSDPENPTKDITIQGDVTPMPEDAPGGATLRPLDWTTTVSGTLGSWVELTHTLGPDPQMLHPVKVWSQDYSKLWGVGKYATDFGQGTASYEEFGDGRDGPLVVSSGQVIMVDEVRTGLSSNVNAGATVIPLDSASGFSPGDLVLIHQSSGVGLGAWERLRIVSNSGIAISIVGELKNSYLEGSGSAAQVVRIPQYTNCSINSGGTLTAHNWNGNTGGIAAFVCNGGLIVDGLVDLSGKGLLPTEGQGCSSNSPVPGKDNCGDGGGGGLAYGGGKSGGGGGGGGNASSGGSGGPGTGGWDGLYNGAGGPGGEAAGTSDLTNITMGGGGGGGGCSFSQCNGNRYDGGGLGGAGGGILVVASREINIGSGSLWAKGANGAASIPNIPSGGGGGGAGGSVMIRGVNIAVGSDRIKVQGGSGDVGNTACNNLNGGDGGAGSIGRIRIEHCETFSGTTGPEASIQKLNCHIIEQVESSPYDHARLNLPESGSHTYRVQYGRRLVFGDAGMQTQSIRMPKQLYATATVDALVSNTGISSGDLSLSLDIGGDGTGDWAYNNTTTFPISFTLTSLANALNAYVVNQTGAAWGADIDVPMKLTINRQADVILTNLVLTLQSNQPGALVAAVDTGADRPLDVPVSVIGPHTQGEWVTYDHALGPDALTLHPVKAYSQNYTTLWGMGRYATDFGQGTASADMFGDGSEGDLTVGAGQTAVLASAMSALAVSCSAGQPSIVLASSAGFANGNEVMVLQAQGSSAGNYEFGTIASISGNTLTLTRNLSRLYYANTSDKAQVLRIPHYHNVTVQGRLIPSTGWNGSVGGVIAFRANGTLFVQGSTGGKIDVKGYGFRGGVMPDSGWYASGYSGESYSGPSQYSSLANGGGGGGGGDYNNQAGSGAGYGTRGTNGEGVGGTDDIHRGYTYGDSALASLHLGSGGGTPSGVGPNGGGGGGAVLIFAKDMAISGQILSGGANGENQHSAGGPSGAGGSGGSIKLVGQSISLGSNLVVATGGIGGYSDWKTGGTGGVGRIRLEYCDSLTGTTNPAASSQKLNCYIVEQIDADPYNQGRLNLPEPVTASRIYQVQYGRRYTFSGAAARESYLRVNRRMYGTASLDVLISNTGVTSGNLDLCLDIGNDGDCDYHPTGTQTFPLTLSTDELADAFNDYLVTRSDIPWGNPVDVPVRVQVDRQADVMLTNLALTPVGVKTRFLRLPARDYSEVTLDILFGETGDPTGPLAFTVDVGADGTVDWTDSRNLAYPATVHNPNLAAAFNSYLAGRTGEVDVPIRITPSPSPFTALDAFSTRTTAQPDATLSTSDISFSTADPVEGDEVTVSATLHNTGGLDAGRVTTSFYATSTDWGEWYIGSAFVPNVPAGGTAQAEIMWNTLGFTGTVPMRVSIDPYNRLAETNEANNEASKSLTIRTRPDLRVTQIALSDDEPMSGESVTVTLALRNDGQTAAADSALALYDGNPDAGGTLVCERSAGVAGGGQMTPTCTWTLATPGLHRLFARADRDWQVNEYDEGNNDTWRDVYVGFLSPNSVDSGEIASDVAYTSTLGYGAVDEGQPDEFGSCGDKPWQTFRRDPGGRAVYRFDHLLPGHFYHLDLSLYLCGQAARDESVFVDGNLVAGPVALGDGQNHRLSLRLDPVLYADRAISMTVETAGLGGAIVNEVNLYDVDYRYSDAGGVNDPAYTAGRGYGYLNGVARTQWGTLPYRSLRENQSGNTVSYRYDGLLQSKRYQTFLSFWQNTGSPITQKVQINGVDTGTVLTIQSGTPYSVTINVPTSYYVNGMITVSVVRTDASTSAMVNEIAVEERTLLTLPEISDVRVTNIGDTSASLSWISADPADGQAHYGPTAALGAIGQDDRGAATVSRTHQVTLLDLTPQTTYYFYVTSADSVGRAAGGALYQFTTGPTLSLPASDLIYGQVFNPDSTPAAGALVYVTLRDADGLDSPGTAAPLSALVDTGGYWSLNLGGARTADNQAPFSYDPAADRLDISATQGTGCAANLTTTTADDSPAASMTLACPTQVTHSLAASWNLIGLTVQSDPATAAEAALDDIVDQGGSAIEIERWWNGGWDAHVRDLPFNNFTLELGRGYFIRSSAASTWTRTGTPPTSPLPVELYPGWNLVSTPKLTCSLLAEDVLVAIAAQGGACGEIDRWYAGNWQGHIKGLSFNNFAMATDQGYFVKCTQRSTYVPCQATAQSAVTAWPPAVAPVAATPAPNPTIRDVRVTNRRDVAFTVTWRTDRPSIGWVAYRADGETDQVAHDDRGADAVSTLHHVTVTGLAPQTAYTFRIHAGKETADRGGMPFQVTTAVPTTPAVPLTAYGQVYDAAGQPVAGALVRAWINDAAGATSEPLSALSDGWSYWTLSVPAGDCSDRTLFMEALGPDGAVARMTQPACAESAQPAPTLTLGPDTRRTIYLPLVIR